MGKKRPPNLRKQYQAVLKRHGVDATGCRNWQELANTLARHVGHEGRIRKPRQFVESEMKKRSWLLPVKAGPVWLEHAAASTFSVRKERAHKLGKSFGAAGPCKRIDPKTGEVIEVMGEGQ